MEPHNQAMLTVEQFAEMMQVSRTTVFGWLKSGAVAEGVHYIRLGRVLRFRWGLDLFFNSQPRPVSECPGPLSSLPGPRSEQDFKRGEAPVNSPPLTFDRGSAPGVNLDY